MVDHHTGLGNRRALEERYDYEWKIAKRHGRDLSVLVADLDGLKRINDEYGHHVGDAVLSEVAGDLMEASRSTDFVARTGGDEFIVVCPETDAEGATRLSERIVERVALLHPHAQGAWPLHLGVSVGWATVRDDHDPNALLREADKHLYTSKREGGNRVSGPSRPLVA